MVQCVHDSWVYSDILKHLCCCCVLHRVYGQRGRIVRLLSRTYSVLAKSAPYKLLELCTEMLVFEAINDWIHAHVAHD